MTFKLKSGLLAMAVLTAMVSPAFGQILNTEGTDAPAETAAPAEAAAPTNFSQTTSVFDNWSVQCREAADKKTCYSETVIRQSKPKVRDLLVLRMSKGADGTAMAIVTPNRVKLANGVVLSVGDTSLPGAFVICGATNCSAQLTLTDDVQAALSSQEQAFVSFFIFSSKDEGGEKEIKLPVSLAGFSAALENLAANE